MRSRANQRRGWGVEGLEQRLVLSVVDHGLSTAADYSPLSATTRDQHASAISNVTDPRIIKQGKTYDLFSTGPGIPIRQSTDLIHWTRAGQVFEGLPAWARAKVPGATEPWAPDISYFNGQYHLYYAVSTFGGNRSVIGLATSPTLDPTHPGAHWTDRGEVIESTPGRSRFNAIDPNITFDSKSNPWLAFGSQWSGIKLVRIDPHTGKLRDRGADPQLTALAARPAGMPIEAPFVFRRNGSYYLFDSFDNCCQGADSTYKIMVGRSKQIAGPYLDRSGTPMLRGGGTLVLKSAGRDRGPGHNAILSDGGRDWLVYHDYDAQDQGIAKLGVRPLTWDAQGWPVVGAPLF